MEIFYPDPYDIGISVVDPLIIKASEEMFGTRPDWVIRNAANIGIHLFELEQALPGSLLDGEEADRVLGAGEPEPSY